MKFRATSSEGIVSEYEADSPQPEHLSAGWKLSEVISADTPPELQPPADTRKYGGRRLLTKLEFIELLGDAAYQGILSMAKMSIQIEAWVKKMELNTPDAEGYSVDLDDPRTSGGVIAISMALEAQGVVDANWENEVLNG